MNFRLSVLTALLACVYAVIAAGSGGRTCMSRTPSLKFVDTVKALSQEDSMKTSFEKPSKIVISTYFHVVAASRALEGGWVTKKMLSDQLAVMNSDFAPHGFSFKLIKTTRTVKPSWTGEAHFDKELEMKRTLRKGSYRDLNVFIVPTDDFLGYANFPDIVDPGTDDFMLDGIVIVPNSLPGGNETNYNLGRTATHEIGHWLGLYHTFGSDEGCKGSYTGDFVEDTPAQNNATEGCPTGRDSCAQHGLDPIHNYMDYSYDSCVDEFTPGQRRRMHRSWEIFRANGNKN